MKRSIVSAAWVAANIMVAPVLLAQQSPGCEVPAVLSQPTGGTRAPGQAISLTVTAGGTAPLHYQWRKDGVDLPGATNSALVLDPVFFEDAGSYGVRISNACGSASSAAAMLVVEDNTPPAITCAPNKVAPCSGNWSFNLPVASDECVFDALVYDNSLNDLLLRFNSGTLEIGDEIILDGAARNPSQFVFEYWGVNTMQAEFEGPVHARVRFYGNDGALFAGVPAPGTLLYDSGPFPVGATPRATLIIEDFTRDALVPLAGTVPDQFTWTVQFSGLGANDQAGLDIYSPVVVGQSYADYWEHSGDAWVLKTNTAGPVDFAARLDATYGEVTVAVVGTTTNWLGDGALEMTRTWVASDPSGNTAECSQTVTLRAPLRASLALPAGEDLALPAPAEQLANPIQVMVESAYPQSFMTATLSEVPMGYSISEGTYTAWDVDYWKYIYSGPTYAAVAYDTTRALPAELADANWAKVNYILNHKLGNAYDVQNAIWHYIGGPVDPGDTYFSPPSWKTLQLIAEADAHADGFVPGPGGICAVLLDYTGAGVAHSIIEVRRPITLTRCEGEALSLCADASGSAPITFAWYHDNVLMTETGSCLEFPALTPAAAGQYRVEIAGACGSASLPVTLTVRARATATPLASLARAPGTTAVFSTTAGGQGPFTYRWRHDGVEIAGETGDTLTLAAVTTGDAGPYSVEVSGACNSVTQTATLLVSSPPVFESPVRQSNGTLSFTFNGGQGMNCVIQASTNLVDWVEVANVPNTTGVLTWTDPEASQHPKRFYRVLLEP